MLLVWVGLVLCYGELFHPQSIVVNHMEVSGESLHPLLCGKVVVLISDLHMDKVGEREQEVLRILRGLDPDFIFVTGDYINWKSDPEPALAFLSRLHAKIGVWAVMGDYDYGVPRKSCLFCHQDESGKPTRRHSVHFLRDSVTQLQLPEGPMWIGGIDPGGERPVAPVTAKTPLHGIGPGIILSHSPLQYDFIEDNCDVVMLAGDTHGGQIPLASFVWRLLGYEKNARYEQGIFRQGRKQMVVTRGIGTSHLAIRFLRCPEIVVLQF